METQRLTVDTEELMEFYREQLPLTESLPLRITGNSMAPFLADGRDEVMLSAVRRPLQVGDIVLYRRDSGQYILHRICALDGESFTLIGDAHTLREEGIRRDQIFAVAVSARRKGVRQAPGCFWWDFFARVWVRIIPLRPALMKLYSLFRGKSGG